MRYETNVLSFQKETSRHREVRGAWERAAGALLACLGECRGSLVPDGRTTDVLVVRRRPYG